MRWRREKRIERGKTWTDYVAGDFQIQKGMNEDERRAGRPYCLTMGGVVIGFASSLERARGMAVEHVEGRVV